ncbi:Y-family DNA polymerase [Marinobacter sp. DUT-3]|uniref:Y-family DNA polymerase n=1 Tax=Marinobacter sp. DUT-3 TaxID=3412036 RepID=UPI003D16EFF2
MLWVYLHFPHLLLDHIRRSRKNGENGRENGRENAEEALVVVEAAGQRVLQACPEAQDQGVQPGMPLKTAITLVPSLAIARADTSREQQILAEQARWLYRHAANITPYPPDGLLAEVGSLQKLYGGLAAVWQTFEQALSQRQLTAWMATGKTPLAARLCARAGQGQCTTDRDHMMQQLSRLPLTAVELDGRTLTRLQRMGLTRLGEVMQLPAREMAHRLSPDTLAYIQKIQGTRPDPQQPWRPPHHFRQQADFAQDIEHSEGLLFPLHRILGELEEDLCWRQQDTDSLLLVLNHRHHQPTRLRIRTSGPEHRAEAFLDLLRLRFEQHPLKAPVTSLVLSVRRFMGREASNGNDLLGETPDLNEAWHTLISRLQARLGENALQQLSPRADHRPEHAWTTANLPQRAHATSPEASNLPHRPLWLLKSPHPLQETPSAWFSGPERISGGWWDGQRVHRDYYIAQLASGQLAWVFRDVRDGWFVHGWFG